MPVYNGRKRKVRSLWQRGGLVYRHILENGPVNEAEVGNIDGIDPQKLSVNELLNHMREMGLIEVINDQAHLREGFGDKWLAFKRTTGL